MMTQSSKSRQLSSLTTTILNLRLPKIISLLILELKCALPPLPLPLHPSPTRAALQPSCQILPNIHSLFSPQINLTSQGNSLPQFQIIRQVTLPELSLHIFHNIIQMKPLHNNLYPFLLHIQNFSLPVEMPQDCVVYTHLSIHHKNLPHVFFCTKYLLYQWISLKLIVSDTIW